MFNMTMDGSISKEPSETVDLKKLRNDVSNSIIPGTAPAAGFRGQGSQTQRNKKENEQSKQSGIVQQFHNKILIDDCNGYPDNIRELNLNEDSIVFTPPTETRNLYS
jgi:hypothetical protein